MLHNLLIIVAAALVPMVLGFIWYNPKVFGNAWMQAADMTEEKMKGANMPIIFGVSFLLSMMLAAFTITLCVHQTHLMSLFDDQTGPEAQEALKGLMELYGDRFRTFKHGALHGTIGGIFLVLPILGTNALFERKGFKYILVNVGYWTVCLALMQGILCQFITL